MLDTSAPQGSPLTLSLDDERANVESWVRARPWTELDLEPELRSSIAKRGDVETLHRTRAFTSNAWRYARISLIHSSRGTLIVNLACFPHAHSGLPVAQAELVVVRGRTVLALYDLHELGPTGAQPGAQPGAQTPVGFSQALAARYPELAPVTERPEWTVGVVSPSALWSRPANAESVPAALGAMADFLDWCAQAEDGAAQGGLSGGQAPELSEASENSETSDAVSASLATICRNSIAANPSKAFLGSLYGADWADRFLAQVLYPERIYRPG